MVFEIYAVHLDKIHNLFKTMTNVPVFVRLSILASIRSTGLASGRSRGPTPAQGSRERPGERVGAVDVQDEFLVCRTSGSSAPHRSDFA
jgi:hypothetical protein